MILNCTNCTIEGITWSGCGEIIDIIGHNYTSTVLKSFNQPSINYPVLEFFNSSNIKIQNCIFKHSKGQAVTLSGMTGDVSIKHCTFSHNNYSGIHGGAAVHIRNQKIRNPHKNPQVNITIRYCNFTDNRGTSIVYIGYSNDQPLEEFYLHSIPQVANITIRNCKFTDNRGTSIVYIEHLNDQPFEEEVYFYDIPQVANITIRNCKFTYNRGTSIYIVYIGQSDDESFEKISFHDLVFSDNEGVAVYLNHQNLYMYGDFCFKQNTAENGAGMFISNESNVYFTENSFVEFRENIASDSGGAIFLSSDSTISFGQRSEFINNQAGNKGGAIALHNNSFITDVNSISTILDFYKQRNFLLKYGELSSMVFLNNNANSSGGAIFLSSNSTISFGLKSEFINNQAGNNGGAIALHSNSFITVDDSINTIFNFSERFYFF